MITRIQRERATTRTALPSYTLDLVSCARPHGCESNQPVLSAQPVIQPGVRPAPPPLCKGVFLSPSSRPQWLPVRQSQDDGTIKNPRLPLLVATSRASPVFALQGFLLSSKSPPFSLPFSPNNTIAEESRQSHLFGPGCWNLLGFIPFHPVFSFLTTICLSVNHCKFPFFSFSSPCR